MKYTRIPLPAPVSQRIPFAQATSEQLYRAERFVQDALAAKFPLMLEETWETALQVLQPNLWATSDTVSLDAADLARVTLHLRSQPDFIGAQAGLGWRKLYFIRQPMDCPAEVFHALAELEADPRACGPAVYELVAAVARDHAEVEKCGWSKVKDPGEPDGTDSDQARAALLARVEALDRARGVAAGNDPAENCQSR